MVGGSKNRIFALQKGYVDDKTAMHIAFDGAFIHPVNALNGNHFDIGGNAVRGAVIKHFLGFGQAANSRIGQSATLYPFDWLYKSTQTSKFAARDQGYYQFRGAPTTEMLGRAGFFMPSPRKNPGCGG